MTKKKLLEDIKTRPARCYRMPADVLRDRRFADDERLEILQAWAISPADDTIAQQIDEAMAQIHERQTNDHAAE